MKYSKIYISFFVCVIIGFGFIAYLMGYRFPEFDKHRDWTFIPENNDAVFEIEKTNTKLGSIRIVPNHKGLLSTIEENGFLFVKVITEKGKTIKAFPKTKDFYIDSLNQRFIFSNEIYKSDTLFKKELVSYRFSDYKKQNLELEDFVIEETITEFAKRKNYPEKEKLNYEQTEKLEKQIKEAYIKEKEQEVYFYKTLYPVTKISTQLSPLDTEFYTNQKGELYTVEKTRVKTDNIHNMWNSIYPLFPKYGGKMNPEIFEASILNSSTYEEMEKPTIESNFLYTGYLNASFRQHHTNYYRIKFGNKYFNFKYKDKAIAFPNQLNIPKSENDTLACLIDDTLYWIYPKVNKIRKQ
ncbi:MAG: hypothetical protein KA796_14655 [Chryseobacterium sp.]|nr:hypothetical protein [Chryseobacterium sp.]